MVFDDRLLFLSDAQIVLIPWGCQQTGWRGNSSAEAGEGGRLGNVQRRK